MNKTLYLEMTEGFQFHILFSVSVQHIKKNSYTAVTLHSLLGFWLNRRMYILSLGKESVFPLLSLKTQEMKISYKKQPTSL